MCKFDTGLHPIYFSPFVSCVDTFTSNPHVFSFVVTCSFFYLMRPFHIRLPIYPAFPSSRTEINVSAFTQLHKYNEAQKVQNKTHNFSILCYLINLLKRREIGCATAMPIPKKPNGNKKNCTV